MRTVVDKKRKGIFFENRMRKKHRYEKMVGMF